MKRIVERLEKEMRRARNVCLNFELGTAQNKINQQLYDEASVDAAALSTLNFVLEDYFRVLLNTTAWDELKPRERILIRAYRATGGLSDIPDPEGRLLRD